MSLSSKFTNSSSKQVNESYYSCNQGYAPWNPTPYRPHELGYDAYQSYGFGDAYYGYEDPSPPYPPFQNGNEEVFQLLCQEMKEIREIQKEFANQVNTLCSIMIQWMTQSVIGNFNNSSSTSQPLNSEDRPSKSLPNPRGCIPTSSRCKGRKGTLSHHGPINGEAFLLYTSTKKERRTHSFLNHCQINGEAFLLCFAAPTKKKERMHYYMKRMNPSKVPSELHFKLANPYDMSCLGPLRYGLIETDGQLKALCGVLDKKKMDSMELTESKFKECNGLLYKLHNNKAKIGRANRVWDPEKSSMDHHWEVTHCMGALRSLNPLGHTNFKHWWGFKDEFNHKPP
ncbi:hypothetical protein PIB30_047705 [Stylosanthes scabra]|uniref:Uncharacterized protein n=1 Tax=Stylosanthes scabra TaxID=79078 RepID=A0ABU6SGS4_9FABA|nr:hypothetical protein [Stylosanthes scabra]